jgi:hypothetical protein
VNKLKEIESSLGSEKVIAAYRIQNDKTIEIPLTEANRNMDFEKDTIHLSSNMTYFDKENSIVGMSFVVSDPQNVSISLYENHLVIRTSTINTKRINAPKDKVEWINHTFVMVLKDYEMSREDMRKALKNASYKENKWLIIKVLIDTNH